MLSALSLFAAKAASADSFPPPNPQLLDVNQHTKNHEWRCHSEQGTSVISVLEIIVIQRLGSLGHKPRKRLLLEHNVFEDYHKTKHAHDLAVYPVSVSSCFASPCSFSSVVISSAPQRWWYTLPSLVFPTVANSTWFTYQLVTRLSVVRNLLFSLLNLVESMVLLNTFTASPQASFRSHSSL